jgi:hypothetical protein
VWRTPIWCLVVLAWLTRISAPFGSARISALDGSMPQTRVYAVMTRRTISHICHGRCGGAVSIDAAVVRCCPVRATCHNKDLDFPTPA